MCIAAEFPTWSSWVGYVWSCEDEAQVGTETQGILEMLEL